VFHPPRAEVQPVLDGVSTLLAEGVRKGLKSEGDELLEELFISFPLFFGGGVLGYIVGQGAKDQLPDEKLAAAVAPLVAVVFVVGGKTGALGAASGILAKVSFDAWNLFAGLVLPGALLKY